ncbi:methyltransferase domain protein [Burkholderia thailandensis MSMB121]|uniref:L-histidine N(alpha)-methyltransferase n=1 Tax=Burkholderia humptydooensis TaxID=430531 RepID=UPI0003280620|nr:L-histidine N(alpha)-methyltransferase [Burkholderia humptydooensis]AGK50852.1 methyltransferase domain protein [Burkholderia thailandensis MSMB121]ATF33046.1 L-histidine N(alpha)-methyltransferase [Burkholderia thailandensis]KST70772.1 dimethylhistidine N-methyltransferase [Burkholderia humptydooensis]
MDEAAAGVAIDTMRDSAFGHDLLAGLRRSPRSIAPKYFYDAAGSALFDRICELPEYYPTRTELAILKRRAHEIAAQIGRDANLIEFGAGSLSKIRVLLDACAASNPPVRYLPVDISAEHLAQSAAALRDAYPWLDVQPVVADYLQSEQLRAIERVNGRRVGCFLGSTIGNFSRDEASAFLRRAASLLKGGGLLIGVDLVKDVSILHRAYNDAAGVTAAFNLNLLERANAELGADFALGAWAHRAFYDVDHQRIEMHLVSRRAQTVRVAGYAFRFEAGETLHTENSHKFTVDGFRALAQAAGFTPGTVWIDDARLFSVHWLESRG